MQEETDPRTDTSGEILVQVENLSKSYGDIRAVDGVSFEVRRGEVLGFLGPNGAGKTTAMKMITGFLEPDAGRVLVGGQDVAEHPIAVRRRFGYLPENAPAYGEMTVDGFLDFVADVRALEAPAQAVTRAVDLARLGRVRGQTIETLSKGFKRRVGLAQALIHDPEVLILDEPTDGLDPNQKAVVQELISSLSADRAIILSTHILDEAERVCDRAVILSEGKILVDSTPAELITRAPGHNTICFRMQGDRSEVIATLQARDWCAEATAVGLDEVEARPVGGRNCLTELLATVGESRVSDVRILEGRLDDLFRDVTKGIAA